LITTAKKANVLTLLGDAILVIAPKGYKKKARQLLEAAEKVDLRYCQPPF